jgi:hypothetical protein
MSETAGIMLWLQKNLPRITQALRKDKWLIAGFTILLGVVGLAMGAMFLQQSKSTVLLVVAPMPTQGDANPMEIAPKMDITSIGLLCEGDEIIRRTMDELTASGKLLKPPQNLRVLRSSLMHVITVAKETPMSKDYTDILELTANAKYPEDAELMVNTWAKQVIAVVDRYEDNIEKPMRKIFDENYGEARTALEKAEDERETWQGKNNMLFLRSEQAKLTQMITGEIDDLAKIKADHSFEMARARGFQESLKLLKPKETLNWSIPDTAVAESLAARFGFSDAQKSSQGPTASEKQEDEGRESDQPASHAVLTGETVNDVYWDINSEFVKSQAMVEGWDAKQKYVEQLLAENTQKLDHLNAEYRRLEKEQERLDRMYQLTRLVHDELFPRRAWVDIAARVDYPTLQVLSSGEVWPQSRLAAVVLATVMAGLGFIAAVCTSLFVRLFAQPALKAAS